MRAASTPIAERMLRYAWRIYHGGEVTTAWIMTRFRVSPMTAKRDMDVLLRALPVRQAEPTRRGRARRIALAKRQVVHLFDGDAR